MTIPTRVPSGVGDDDRDETESTGMEVLEDIKRKKRELRRAAEEDDGTGGTVEDPTGSLSGGDILGPTGGKIEEELTDPVPDQTGAQETTRDIREQVRSEQPGTPDRAGGTETADGPRQQDGTGAGGIQAPTLTEGVESKEFARSPNVASQAQQLEARVIQEVEGITDPEQVAVVEEDGQLRAQLTRAGIEQRLVRGAIESSPFVDEPGDVDVFEQDGQLSIRLSQAGRQDFRQQQSTLMGTPIGPGLAANVSTAQLPKSPDRKGPGERTGLFDPTAGRVAVDPEAEAQAGAELKAQQVEEDLEQQGVRVPDAVPFLGGTKITGRGRDVEVTPKTEPTEEGTRITFEVEEQEQAPFGDFSIGVPGTDRDVESFLEEFQEGSIKLAGDITEPLIGERTTPPERLFELSAGVTEALTGEEIELKPEGREKLKEFQRGNVEGAAGFTTGLPLIAKEAGEFGVAGARETAAGRGEEFAGAAGSAAVGRTILTGEALVDRPGRVGGTLTGSAAASLGVLGVARFAGGPRTARATSFAIQPGEELAITAARRTPFPTGVASAVGDISRKEIERGKGFAGAERGQLDFGARGEREERITLTEQDIATERATAELDEPTRLSGIGREVATGARKPEKAGLTERGEFVGSFTRRQDPAFGGTGKPDIGGERDFGAALERAGMAEPEPAPTAPTLGATDIIRSEPGVPGEEASGDLLGLAVGEALERQEEALTPAVFQGRPEPAGAFTRADVQSVLDEQLTTLELQQTAAVEPRGEVAPTLGLESLTALEERADTRQRTDLLERLEPRQEPRAEPRTETRVEPRQEPRLEPRLEPRTEPRQEPRVEPRVEPRFEPRTEPRQEPRVEPRAEFRVEPFLFGEERDVPDRDDDRERLPFLEEQVEFDLPDVGDLVGFGGFDV